MSTKLRISPKNRILRAAIKRFEEAVVAYKTPATYPSLIDQQENDLYLGEEYRLAKANLNSLIGLTRKTK